MPSHINKSSVSTETDGLIESHDKLSESDSKNNDHFVISKSAWEETKILLNLAIRIGSAIVFEVAPQNIANIFLGHLPNAAAIIAGTGLAKSFANVTGTSLCWGFTSGLWTLIPQAIGANRKELMSIYVQRAFIVTSFVLTFTTIIQFFAADLLILIGQNRNLYAILQNYCRSLIPYMWLLVLLTICQRIGQAVHLNTHLFYVVFIPCLLCIPFYYLFMNVLYWGYLGTAFVINLTMFLSVILAFILLIYMKDYGYVFKPLSLKIVCNKYGISDYLSLSIPGMIQNSLSWWIGEIVVVLSGYVYKPNIAVSVSVITFAMYIFIILMSEGFGNALNLRVGKYIGFGSIIKAKQCIMLTCLISIIYVILIIIFLWIFKDKWPYLFTSNSDITNLCSSVMTFILIIRCTVFTGYNVAASIYRAMGYQKLCAYTMLFSHYVIALPLTCIALFYYKYKDNTMYGVLTIWIGSTAGYLIGAIILILILYFYINWNDVMDKSQMRIKKTIKDYGSITNLQNNQ